MIDVDVRESAGDARCADRRTLRINLAVRAGPLPAAEHMVVAAKTIVDWPGVHYAAGGRGPLEFDSFGLVRACAQAVVDLNRDYPQLSSVLADIDIPVTEPGATEVMLDTIERWGMRRIRPFDAEAGDVVIGRIGWPVAQVVIENHQMLAGIPCAFAHSAHVMPGSVPAIRHIGAMSSTLFAAFTWRDTEFQSPAAPLGGSDVGAPRDSEGLAAQCLTGVGQPGSFSKETA